MIGQKYGLDRFFSNSTTDVDIDPLNRLVTSEIVKIDFGPKSPLDNWCHFTQIIERKRVKVSDKQIVW